MKTKLSEIIITSAFKKANPHLNKLLKCMTYYAKYGKLDRDIIITKDGVLVDGYVAYLTLVSLGVKKWKCVRDNSYQWYVQGRHDNCKKIYTWKLPSSLITNGLPNVYKDERYLIKTSKDIDVVEITRVFMSNKPPIDGDILDFTFA